MNEGQWGTSDRPQEMLTWLYRTGRVSDRKARSFACACLRSAWGLLPDGRSREAVLVAERFNDGGAGDRQLSAASAAAVKATWSVEEGGEADLATQAACLAPSPASVDTMQVAALLNV